jgi:hypothetical protein
LTKLVSAYLELQTVKVELNLATFSLSLSFSFLLLAPVHDVQTFGNGITQCKPQDEEQRNQSDKV